MLESEKLTLLMPQIGSRVRIVSLEALTEALTRGETGDTTSSQNVERSLQDLKTNALRLVCERQESVRACAIRQLSLLRHPLTKYVRQPWHLYGTNVFHFNSDPAKLNPLSSMLRTILSQIPNMSEASRLTVLSGIVTSVGHPPEMQLPATREYQKWLQTLNSSPEKVYYTEEHHLEDLLKILATAKLSNRIIVPTMHASAILLEREGADENSPRSPWTEGIIAKLQSIIAGSERNTRVQSKIVAVNRLYVHHAYLFPSATTALDPY